MLKLARRVTQRSPLGETETGARRGRGEVLPPLPEETIAKLRERRPLPWDREAARVLPPLPAGEGWGEGGGRATLLKPARRVTQRSPLGGD